MPFYLFMIYSFCRLQCYRDGIFFVSKAFFWAFYKKRDS